MYLVPKSLCMGERNSGLFNNVSISPMNWTTINPCLKGKDSYTTACPVFNTSFYSAKNSLSVFVVISKRLQNIII